jgi:Xaa-Pro aminopeptidase
MPAKYGLGQAAVDWEERYDFPALRRKRLGAANYAISELEVDGLLLWKDENVRYLTSLRAQLIAGKSSSLNGVLLAGDGEPVLLASGGEIDKAHFGMPWIGSLHAVPIMEQPELVDGFVEKTLVPLIRDRGLEYGKLGLD